MFLTIQLFIFRTMDNRQLMSALMRIFIVAAVIMIVYIYALSVLVFQKSSGEVLFQLILACLIFGASCFIYVTAVFGITVTSVRIQILRMISRTGSRGLGYGEIFGKYNKHVIVKTRLERLVGSGQLIRNKNKYYLPAKTTFFILYTKFLVWLYNVFGDSGYE